MIVNVKGRKKTIITKEVTVGCGIMFQLPGTRYNATAEVETVNTQEYYADARLPDGRMLRVHGNLILDVVSSGDLAVSAALDSVDTSDLDK